MRLQCIPLSSPDPDPDPGPDFDLNRWLSAALLTLEEAAHQPHHLQVRQAAVPVAVQLVKRGLHLLRQQQQHWLEEEQNSMVWTR